MSTSLSSDRTVTPAVAAPPLTRGEVLRKTLHVLPGFLPFVFIHLPYEDPLKPDEVWFVVVVTAMITAVYLACARFVRRRDEADFISTALSYPATVMSVFVLFPGNVEFAGTVVAVLAFGDPAACLLGSALGRSPLPWNPRKSWTGTISFFAVAAVPATLAYYVLAQPDVPVLEAAVCGVSAAFTAAIAESLPARVTDNLRIGLAAAVTVVAAHFLSAGWFIS